MLNPPRGFKDIIPPQSELFTHIENTARDIFKVFNYLEIKTPTLEYKELFIKSTGEGSDIVQKEMYIFSDPSNRVLALRPEGTPGVVRAFINNSMHMWGKKTKFFYIANMFRAERPQAGRYREFEQIGVEYLGEKEPYADAEVIIMLDTFLKKLLLSDYKIEINSLGCRECRSRYKEEIISYLSKKDLCNDCRIRLSKNPLRVLDCKVDRDQFSDIPRMDLCRECLIHYNKLKELLNKSGIEFYENHLLVRGLDYYTRTVFEFKTDLLGSQDAIGAGGRYDNLVSSMGGPDIPGIGWACGVERILMLIEKKGLTPQKREKKVFIIAQPGYEDHAFEITNRIRANSIICDTAPWGRSMKAQFRSADSNNADYAIIIGEDEVKNSYLTIRNLKNSTQIKIEQSRVIDFLKNPEDK